MNLEIREGSNGVTSVPSPPAFAYRSFETSNKAAQLQSQLTITNWASPAVADSTLANFLERTLHKWNGPGA